MPSDITEARVSANGLEFAILEAGPSDGPLVLLLHGFPDTAWTWRHLLPDLGDAGYHAVAPFMRGYAPTGVPADGLYQTGALVRDAGSLHEALGGDENAVVVGHDWGASAAYGTAALSPERWRKVVTAAVPPFATLAAGFFSFAQLKRSWYMFFFQVSLAEIAVPMNDHAF
ncbi:MAG TPA: alpha/beta fold hydrolase, partial [Acidimicrobiales bacterium]|nr:alpha/beta fold hydrolase [Acidimicrobiales bacterium]